MRFEHLIQVNDFLNPLVDALTREQLWNGLVASLEDPARFLPGLDRAVLTARDGAGFSRELHFGHVTIRDRVRLEPPGRLSSESEATPEVPALVRTVTIEEPIEGELVLRFVYERRAQGHAPLEPAYARVLEEAWLKADIDLVATLRRIATRH